MHNPQASHAGGGIKVSSLFSNSCMVCSLKGTASKLNHHHQQGLVQKGFQFQNYGMEKQLTIVASKPCYHIMPPFELFWLVIQVPSPRP